MPQPETMNRPTPRWAKILGGLALVSVMAGLEQGFMQLKPWVGEHEPAISQANSQPAHALSNLVKVPK